MVDYGEALGPWIERKVAERGVSQRAAAKEMGVTPGMLNAWIKGHKRPNMASVERLAAFLVVPVEEVLTRAGYRRHRDMDLHPERAELLELARQIPLSEARVCADYLRYRMREAQAGRGMDRLSPPPGRGAVNGRGAAEE